MWIVGNIVHAMTSRATLLWPDMISADDGNGWVVFLYHSLIYVYCYIYRNDLEQYAVQ